MDSENWSVRILVDAKAEYTKQLQDLLTPRFYEGIYSLYDDSKQICQKSGDPNILITFQQLLRTIPKWNKKILENEYQRIIQKSNCDFLEDLITAIFVANTKILTAIKTEKSRHSNRQLDLSVPNGATFIHKCYTQIAREFWKNPYLLDDSISSCDIQRNMRDSYQIIDKAVNESIRKQLPVRHILKEYLGEIEEEQEPDDDLESIMTITERNNLKRMIKKDLPKPVEQLGQDYQKYDLDTQSLHERPKNPETEEIDINLKEELDETEKQELVIEKHESETEGQNLITGGDGRKHNIPEPETEPEPEPEPESEPEHEPEPQPEPQPKPRPEPESNQDQSREKLDGVAETSYRKPVNIEDITSQQSHHTQPENFTRPNLSAFSQSPRLSQHSRVNSIIKEDKGSEFQLVTSNNGIITTQIDISDETPISQEISIQSGTGNLRPTIPDKTRSVTSEIKELVIDSKIDQVTHENVNISVKKNESPTSPEIKSVVIDPGQQSLIMKNRSTEIDSSSGTSSSDLDEQFLDQTTIKTVTLQPVNNTDRKNNKGKTDKRPRNMEYAFYD